MNTAKPIPQIGSESCNAIGIKSNAEIDSYRLSYVGSNYIEVFKNSNIGAVVFSHSNSDGFVFLIAFSGRKKKPDFCYHFSTQERALAHQEKWVAGLMERAVIATAKRKAKSSAHSLNVGDVLVASWGYDQTQYDYYEVTRLIGKQSVEIRELAKFSEENEGMQGDCVPRKRHYKSEPMVKRVGDGGYVKVRSWGVWAHKKEETLVSGVAIFAPDRFTSYA